MGQIIHQLEQQVEYERRQKEEALKQTEDALRRVEEEHYRAENYKEILKKHSIPFEEKTNSNSQQFPISMLSESEIEKRFEGGYIAILDNNIISADESLDAIQRKTDELVPNGMRCTIRYIESGVNFARFENQSDK